MAALTRLRAVAILGGMLFSQAVLADITLPSPPPPQPFAQTVQVMTGGRVEIPLRGVTRSGLQLGFLIRAQPELGSLSDVVIRDRNNAVVTYTHDRKKGAGIDRFRYAVQAPGTGVSTPAEIVIRVVEPAPQFVAPTALDFLDVTSGETRTQVFTLANEGGSSINGKMEVELPWVFTDGDGTYQLGRNQSADFAITFAPNEAGRYSGQVRFSHSNNKIVILTGLATTPVEVDQTSLTFQPSGRDLERAATLVLTNKTEESRMVDVIAPDEIGGSREIKLPPRGSESITFQTDAEFLGVLNGEIEVVGDGLDSAVPFKVFAAPPRIIAVDPSDVVEFEPVMQGRSTIVTVVIKNTGGSPAVLRGQMPPVISLEPPLEREALMPGEQREFRLTLLSTEAGPVEGAVEISAVDGNLLRWSIRGVVEPDPRLGGDTTLEVLRGGTGNGVRRSPTIVRRGPQPAFPEVETIRMVGRTKHTIDLEWDNPDPKISRFDVLRRKLAISESGELTISWEPLKNCVVTVKPDIVSAKITGLKAGEQLTIALVGFDPERRTTGSTIPFTFDSEHNPVIQIPLAPFGILIFGVCVYFLWRERKRRKEAMEESAREFDARM